MPANRCEIFIKKVGAGRGSHGSAGMPVTVKVGWIGGGETIKRVGFYGYSVSRDLGNQSTCHSSAQYGGGVWKTHEPLQGAYGLEYGDYAFNFPVRSGSVVGACPGYEYTWVGTFFVETNRNTYWVNPDMDSKKYFYFDATGYRNLEWKTGAYQQLRTDREDMRYYNPIVCR